MFNLVILALKSLVLLEVSPLLGQLSNVYSTYSKQSNPNWTKVLGLNLLNGLK